MAAQAHHRRHNHSEKDKSEYNIPEENWGFGHNRGTRLIQVATAVRLHLATARLGADVHPISAAIITNILIAGGTVAGTTLCEIVTRLTAGPQHRGH